jgi:drug/metabolite transporter (DMT)-like permease
MPIPFPILSGIALGIFAAFWQACSYFGSRGFLLYTRSSSRALLGLAHVLMGGFALVLLPFAYFHVRDGLMPVGDYILPLLATTFFYLSGQFMLFLALKSMDSSRVAPLLGLKIPILALFSVFFFRETLSVQAVVAVLVCTAGALAISPPTSMPRLGELGLILLTCSAYCLSDISIPKLVNGLNPEPTVWHIVFGVCLSYGLAGLVGVVVSLRVGAFRVERGLGRALPYAACWFAGILCLFGCFTLIGPIFGNMLQSTRGIMTVVLAPLVMKATGLTIDRMSGWAVFVRRVLAAAVMTGAIILYYQVLGK